MNLRRSFRACPMVSTVYQRHGKHMNVLVQSPDSVPMLFHESASMKKLFVLVFFILDRLLTTA